MISNILTCFGRTIPFMLLCIAILIFVLVVKSLTSVSKDDKRAFYKNVFWGLATFFSVWGVFAALANLFLRIR